MPTAVSRRSFLGTVAGAAGAAVLTWPGCAQADNGTDKYGGFLMGIQSYSLRGFPVEKALQIIHDDLGLHSIEFVESHFSVAADDATIKKMKDQTAALDIRMMGHGICAFTKDHQANRRFFEFAKKAGIKNLSSDPTEDSFDSLDKLVAEYNIRVAIHNHGPGSRYDKINDVLTAIKGRDPRIGACADLGHYIRSAEDPVRAIHLFGDRLFGAHLKDFAEQKTQTTGVILGKGHLDVVEVFKGLKKVNFPADGCLSLEYEEKPENPIADLQECLAVASEGAKKAAQA